MIDGAGGLRREGRGASKHERIAEPERHAGDEGDLGDIDHRQSPDRVDAEPDQSAGQDGGAETVTDCRTREARERRDRVGDFGAADDAQREHIVKREGDVAGDDERARECDSLNRLRAESGHHFLEIGAAQQMVKNERRHSEDGQADRCTDRTAAKPGSDLRRDADRHVFVLGGRVNQIELTRAVWAGKLSSNCNRIVTSQKNLTTVRQSTVTQMR